MDGDEGSAPGAIQSIATLASTTGMRAHFIEPAASLLDHQIRRGLMRSAPTAKGGFRQLRPFRKRKLLLFATSCQGLDVAPSHNESIAPFSGSQSARPDPSTNRLSGASGQERSSFHIQFIPWESRHNLALYYTIDVSWCRS